MGDRQGELASARVSDAGTTVTAAIDRADAWMIRIPGTKSHLSAPAAACSSGVAEGRKRLARVGFKPEPALSRTRNKTPRIQHRLVPMGGCRRV